MRSILVAGVLVLSGCTGAQPATSPAPIPTAPISSVPISSVPTAVAPTPSAPASPAAVESLGAAASDLAAAAESMATAAPSAVPSAIVLGADVSWPQCPTGMGIPERRTLGLPMPLPQARFVVLGLTNGPGFTANPCLASQVAWARTRHLPTAAYAVASYPDAATLDRYGDRGPFDASDLGGRLGNAGYQQARFNLATLRRAGVRTPIVWIDVESVPGFDWSSDTGANSWVVAGLARGYLDAGFTVGVYSTPSLWRGVVGEWSLGGVPEWRAAGQTSRAEALSRCGSDWSIQGGPGILAQWVADSRDHNLTCPGVAADLGPWLRR